MTMLTYFDSLKNIYSSILLLECIHTSFHIPDYFWEVLSSPEAPIYSDIGFLGFPPSLHANITMVTYNKPPPPPPCLSSLSNVITCHVLQR